MLQEWTGMWSIHFSTISHQGKGKEVNKLYARNTCMEIFSSWIQKAILYYFRKYFSIKQ